MKILQCYPLLGFVVLLLAWSGPVGAVEDEQTFPGALCKSQLSTSQTQIINGRLFNRGALAQVWTCPIAREVVPPGQVSVEFARITVINRHSSQTLRCTLFSRTAEAAFHDSEVRQTFGGPNAAPTDLVYGDDDANTVFGVDGGYYYFECEIPPMEGGQASGIVSYRITENDGED